MRVAEDDGGDAGGVRMQVQIFARMQHVDQFSVELNGFGGGKIAAHSAVIDVPANCGQGRDGSQCIENVIAANVTGMQDVGATGKCMDGFWTQQSVSIGDDADAHAR